MAQGTSLSRPTTSALMKLAMRPKKRPKGTLAATTSMTVRGVTAWRRANSHMARMVPSMPPWKAMPPFQILRISSGLLQIEQGLVQQNMPEPAADDDAERHPDEEIVRQVRRERRLAVRATAACRRPGASCTCQPSRSPATYASPYHLMDSGPSCSATGSMAG